MAVKGIEGQQPPMSPGETSSLPVFRTSRLNAQTIRRDIITPLFLPAFFQKTTFHLTARRQRHAQTPMLKKTFFGKIITAKKKPDRKNRSGISLFYSRIKPMVRHHPRSSHPYDPGRSSDLRINLLTASSQPCGQ